MAKPERSLASLDRALKRLEEALDEPSSNTLVIDGTIQRFEFCFEALWKTMRKMLFDLKGTETAFPREAFKGAYAVHWIEDEEIWVKMLDDRNETSHIYDEEKAKEIFMRIKTYYPVMRKAYEQLHALYQQQPLKK